jgi:hypothetical protein
LQAIICVATPLVEVTEYTQAQQECWLQAFHDVTLTVPVQEIRIILLFIKPEKKKILFYS